MAITSTAGFIALLEDKSPEIKSYALESLNTLVDEFWPEISECVHKIEILHEDSKFEDRQKAALLASKVYYHLGEYDDALQFALNAQDQFDSEGFSEYTEKMLSKCIDKYISMRMHEEDLPKLKLDKSYEQTEKIVDKIFQRCFQSKQYHELMGIAIETRRLDMFEQSIVKSENVEDMLKYAFKVVLTLTDSVKLRDRLLEVLVSIYTERSSVGDSANICQCLILLNNSLATSKQLISLAKKNEESSLLAYQICFDLYENSTQQFLNSLSQAIKNNPEMKKYFVIEKPTEIVTPPAEGSETKEVVEEKNTNILSSLTGAELEMSKIMNNIVSILSGDKVIEMNLQLLIKNNSADLNLMEKIKDEARSAITHNATIIANGILHCGTTSDSFLRDNLNWLGKAVNWAKFTATATLGVIHKGHEKDARSLMSAYLPHNSNGNGSVYTEGGGLFALGLIHVGHGGNITKYLMDNCNEATSEPVKHGAFLGIGLAAMGTWNEEIYDMLKSNLDKDEAIAGEAAGIAIGLVMLASGSSKAINDLISFAKETIHEKINRGIALGIALIMFGKQEEADELIENLTTDNDAILRWAGMATLAMAYCGTGSNKAIRKLLSAAVSDTSDDVRRWTLTAVGFILFKNPETVPSLLSLLSESYNPHVRYGAAMGVGIACAGTANREAISLLDSLTDGTVAFVRQGALIAQAMVLIQQNGVTCPKSTEFREKCLKIISDRHEDQMVKFGATIARSIIDAGGSNMTISLQSRTGNVNMSAAVGLLIFQNFWFWYPLSNFLSLALTPNSVVALNKDLKMPQMQFLSNAKPSTFAYPPKMSLEKEKKKEKIETSILSIAARQKKKELEKKVLKASKASKETMDVDKKEEKEVQPAPEKEPNQCLLENPARIMRAQQRVLSIPQDSRYKPLKPISSGGFIIMVDTKPEEPEKLVETLIGHGPTQIFNTGNKNDEMGGNKQDGSSSKNAGNAGEDCPTNILGSEVGAFEDGMNPAHNVDLDDDDDIINDVDLNDPMEEDEDGEGSKNVLSPSEMVASPSSKKEPSPPETFQYNSEGEEDNEKNKSSSKNNEAMDTSKEPEK